MSILEEIFAHKRTEVAAAKQVISEAELARGALATPTPTDFAAALQDESCPRPRLITEVKLRSPSKGLLSPDFDPLQLACTYAENGAAAISILTDENYFGGSLEHLRAIAEKLCSSDFSRFHRERTTKVVTTKMQKIPLLRKDFIFDNYQLLEARAAGASAALLIVAMLTQEELTALINAACALKLTPLVEIHTRGELDRALQADAKVIGINNRDLHTFCVKLETSLNLRPQIPPEIVVVSESGIHTQEDVARLAEADMDAMLIGEGIVTAENVGEKVRCLARLGSLNSPTRTTIRTTQTN